ncbi:MAG TPA: DUF6515 family protein [Steroidobacteraceae bacterium]|nr:DUF6515 family protein [Steroidobacteraceae bacterium]
MKLRYLGRVGLAALLLGAGAVTATALADPPDRDHGGRSERGAHRAPAPHVGPGQHYDNRFGHDRVYPARGFVAHDLPRDRFEVWHGHDHFFYSGGVWYAPRGGAFVVVAPPLGVFVPVLPAFYTTLWFGGVPYYYANDAYYTWSAQNNGYEVVDPPPGADTGATAPQPPPAGDRLYVYPKNGQSQEQQSRDQYECYSWAKQQTGFDPTGAGGGAAPGQPPGSRADYDRAWTACLTGRGYTVQ